MPKHKVKTSTSYFAKTQRKKVEHKLDRVEYTIRSGVIVLLRAK